MGDLWEESSGGGGGAGGVSLIQRFDASSFGAPQLSPGATIASTSITDEVEADAEDRIRFDIQDIDRGVTPVAIMVIPINTDAPLPDRFQLRARVLLRQTNLAVGFLIGDPLDVADSHSISIFCDVDGGQPSRRPLIGASSLGSFEASSEGPPLNGGSVLTVEEMSYTINVELRNADSVGAGGPEYLVEVEVRAFGYEAEYTETVDKNAVVEDARVMTSSSISTASLRSSPVLHSYASTWEGKSLRGLGIYSFNPGGVADFRVDFTGFQLNKHPKDM